MRSDRNVTKQSDLRHLTGFRASTGARLAVRKAAIRMTSVSPDREIDLFKWCHVSAHRLDERGLRDVRRLNFAEVVSNVHSVAGRLG
jgi:hypothetical protein